MDQKKLRETLGNFSTGVIIACARRRNFLAEHFFSERFFSENDWVEKFEEFWQNFLQGNPLAQKLESKIPTKIFWKKLKKFLPLNFLE